MNDHPVPMDTKEGGDKIGQTEQKKVKRMGNGHRHWKGKEGWLRFWVNEGIWGKTGQREMENILVS